MPGDLTLVKAALLHMPFLQGLPRGKVRDFRFDSLNELVPRTIAFLFRHVDKRINLERISETLQFEQFIEDKRLGQAWKALKHVADFRTPVHSWPPLSRARFRSRRAIRRTAQ